MTKKAWNREAQTKIEEMKAKREEAIEELGQLRALRHLALTGRKRDLIGTISKLDGEIARLQYLSRQKFSNDFDLSFA